MLTHSLSIKRAINKTLSQTSGLSDGEQIREVEARVIGILMI